MVEKPNGFVARLHGIATTVSIYSIEMEHVY